LTETISGDKTLNLLLIWEAVIDKAQDKAFNQLILKEIKDTVANLIKSLCRDFGEESAARELVRTIMQLILRRMYEPEEFEELDSLVREFNATKIQDNTDYPSNEDLLLYNKLMFYSPNPEEPMWTETFIKSRDFPILQLCYCSNTCV